MWLMCPIKLLQTLPRQLLPAGPWVQIGSVSLLQGGGSRAGEQWPAQSAHRGPSPTARPGPSAAPSSVCSPQHSSGSPRPAGAEWGSLRPILAPIPGSSRAP